MPIVSNVEENKQKIQLLFTNFNVTSPTRLDTLSAVE